MFDSEFVHKHLFLIIAIFVMTVCLWISLFPQIYELMEYVKYDAPAWIQAFVAPLCIGYLLMPETKDYT